MAQQKRIRRLLRLMKVATPGNLAAWEEAYKRWKNLTGIIARPIDELALESSSRIKGFPWSSSTGKVGNHVVTVPEVILIYNLIIIYLFHDFLCNCIFLGTKY